LIFWLLFHQKETIIFKKNIDFLVGKRLREYIANKRVATLLVLKNMQDIIKLIKKI